MKVILEGSSYDVRALLSDSDAGYDRARFEQLQKDLADARMEINRQKGLVENAGHLLADSERRAAAAKNTQLSIKSDVEANTAKIAARDAEIQKLNYEIRSLREKMDNPVCLSEAQEAEIEALYQATVNEYKIAPLVFLMSDQGGREITAEYMFSAVFGLLAAGNRVGAIKEIRNCTGLGLTKTRDLLDAALRRFGCNVGSNNAPLAK